MGSWIYLHVDTVDPQQQYKDYSVFRQFFEAHTLSWHFGNRSVAGVELRWSGSGKVIHATADMNCPMRKVMPRSENALKR